MWYVSWRFPWPRVTVNHLYVSAKQGGKVLHPNARAWADEAVIEMRQHSCYVPTMAGMMFAMLIRFAPPFDGQRHDVDNIVKLVQDTVTRELGWDDYKVSELHVYRWDDVLPEPCVIVSLCMPGVNPLKVIQQDADMAVFGGWLGAIARAQGAFAKGIQQVAGGQET